MKPFELAYLNLLRRKFSTAIAISAIALAVALGGVIFRVFDLTNQRFSTLAGGGTSLVGAKAGGIEILLGALNGEGDFPGFIPYALYETMRTGEVLHFPDGGAPTTDGATLIVPLLFAGKAGDFRVLATNSRFLERPFGEDSVAVAEGRWFENSGEIVLGARAAAALGARVDQEIEVHGWSAAGVSQGTTKRFRVVGVLKENRRVWDRLLFTSLDDGQAMVAANPAALKSSIWGAKVLSFFWVFQDGISAKAMAEIINQRSVAQFVSIHEQREKLRALTSTGEEVGWAIMGFIVILGGLSVSAILVTRFESMHLQIAVLRAIGYQQAEISRWLLAEGALLGGVSVVLGALLDLAIFPQVRAALGKTLPPEVLFSSDLLLAWPVWGTALLATVLATFVPLLRIYRQDVHSSLKTV